MSGPDIRSDLNFHTLHDRVPDAVRVHFDHFFNPVQKLKRRRCVTFPNFSSPPSIAGTTYQLHGRTVEQPILAALKYMQHERR